MGKHFGKIDKRTSNYFGPILAGNIRELQMLLRVGHCDSDGVFCVDAAGCPGFPSITCRNN